MKVGKWMSDSGKDMVRFDWLELGLNACVTVDATFFKDPDLFVRVMNQEIDACKSEAKRLFGEMEVRQ